MNNLDESILQFKDQGAFVITNHLSKDELSRLQVSAERLWVTHKDQGTTPSSKIELEGDALEQEADFISLAYNKQALEIATRILGLNIRLLYFGLMINPPQAPNKKGMAFHQDGGRISQDTGHFPCLSVKIAYWLTDGSIDGRGNFWIIPGSQNLSRLNGDRSGTPAEAKPIFVAAGDSIIFDPRVWHTRKPNLSTITRKVAFYEYGYRWLEPKCHLNKVANSQFANAPVAQQLFTLGRTPWSCYAPKRKDIVIREASSEVS